MVAFHKRADYSLVKHTLIPGFGLLANLGCMLFYLIGPTMGYGTVKEPLIALLVAGIWGLYGGLYFWRSSKAKGKGMLIESKVKVAS
jgi:hypothetical protein